MKIPNIYHIIPWDTGKNIGKSYNKSMEKLNDEEWGCFLDGDAVHTTIFFGKNIEAVISSNSSFSLLTCYTNRIGCPYQIAPGVNQKNNDQDYHRKIGDRLWKVNGARVNDITNSNVLFSGVLILISKSCWIKCGGFKEDGMLGVDNDIHRRAKNNGLRVGLMMGIYVQHWYRGGDRSNTSHLL